MSLLPANGLSGEITHQSNSRHRTTNKKDINLFNMVHTLIRRNSLTLIGRFLLGTEATPTTFQPVRRRVFSKKN